MAASSASAQTRSRRPTDAPAEEKQFDEQTLHIDRVARVVKGGRRFRFRALVVVGDRKGKVGVGLAKGADVSAAITKANDMAKKQLVQVAVHKGTLPHETEARVGGAHILIKPAGAGTGLIAGGVVRTVLEVAGVSNALSKSLGSTNKTNSSYATLEALKQLVPMKQWVTTDSSGKRLAASGKPEKSEASKPASNQKATQPGSKTTTKKPSSASKTSKASEKQA
jgi:small subunit ribosomal protein S5